MRTIIVPAGTAKPVVGLLLNFNQERRGGMALELLLVVEKKEGRSYQRIPLSGAHFKTYLTGLPLPLAHVVRKLSDEYLIDHLVKNGFAWIRDADKPFELLEERHFVFLRQWVSAVLQELKPLVPAVRYLFYLPSGEAFHSTAIRPATLSGATPSLQFVLDRELGLVRLRCSVLVNSGNFPVEDFQRVLIS